MESPADGCLGDAGLDQRQVAVLGAPLPRGLGDAPPGANLESGAFLTHFLPLLPGQASGYLQGVTGEGRRLEGRGSLGTCAGWGRGRTVMWRDPPPLPPA